MWLSILRLRNKIWFVLSNKLAYQISLIITTLLSLVRCTSDSENTFIVSQYQNPTHTATKGKFYYSAFNLILDKSDRLFFHGKDSVMNCCDTGFDPNFPDYIALLPNDLLIYGDNDFSMLVDSVSKLPQLARNSIQIATLSDTLHSKKFFDLVKTLKEKSVSNYAVRLATEEEMEVLKAKIENRPYDFYKVKWTSRFSNILFSPPIPDSGK